MKTYLNYRVASVISFIVFAVMVFMASGCVSGSSKNVDIVNVPGQAPGPTLPRMVEPISLDRSKESYRIYSVILEHKWDKGNIVVRNHTDRGLFQNDEWLDSNVGNSYPDEVRDFKAANDKEMQFENRFDYNGKISLISQEEFKNTIGGGDGWESFRKKYPEASGIVTFSAVGFDRSGSRAVVNVSYLCASHCGNGSFYILEKKDGEWTISKEIGTWIS